ncbi:MAG: hypothetical protein ACD_3C00025G0010 [uncultured bacterium (gcode 4)]|uniref:Uncharacterized protein n=1 Tax=uncultured bacterium (gcode 4) TaxID=1234023 RepID=K2FCE4_9BACT|nr:MAG: hypothetical protein ACD_3C00025G0010 [uncultured bacterium (gcode 4)]
MRKILALLTFLVFIIISHAWLIHAMDMKFMHDTALPASKLFTPKDDIFCSKSLSSNSSCFQEIPESKWIVSWTYKILEIFQASFLVLFTVYSLLILTLKKPEQNVIKILWPPKDSYVSLFWIVRNIN